MASETLPAQYLKAGEEYLTALTALGLHPEFLGWGWQTSTRQWMLVLVSSVIEIGGPLEMSKLLFRAYNMNATPKEISPFIVRVFGSRTLFAPQLIELGRVRPGAKAEMTAKVKGGPTTSFNVESMGRDIGDLHIESRDAYQVDLRNRSHERKTREWIKFKDSVEKLAA